MFRKSLESGLLFLWMFYGFGVVATVVAIGALLAGRLEIFSKEDSYGIMALAVGPAIIIAMFVAAHIPHLLEQYQNRRANKP